MREVISYLGQAVHVSLSRSAFVSTYGGYPIPSGITASYSLKTFLRNTIWPWRTYGIEFTASPQRNCLTGCFRSLPTPKRRSIRQLKYTNSIPNRFPSILLELFLEESRLSTIYRISRSTTSTSSTKISITSVRSSCPIESTTRPRQNNFPRGCKSRNDTNEYLCKTQFIAIVIYYSKSSLIPK
jgi:hypothetical protein